MMVIIVKDPRHPWTNLFMGDDRLHFRSDTDGERLLCVHDVVVIVVDVGIAGGGGEELEDGGGGG